MKQRTQFGMTLIELMVALAIGMFLMIGAMTVFMQSRTTFRVTESLARMQETGRLAISVLEPDIRMAHYWGLTNLTGNITNRARPNAAPGVGTATTCGVNWKINLDEAVDGSNNSYGFGCASTSLPVETNSDTLIVRRASEVAETGALTGANTMRIQSVRGAGPSQIFAGTTVPAGFAAATSETHRLIINGYYVSRTSTLSATVAGVTTLVPSLRVKTLLADGTIDDQEVLPGIEDMQVQFGVDTDAPGTADRGSIDRYINVNNVMIDPTNAGFNPNVEILAVRLWVRVRAERPENGFTDTATYVYADQNVGPFNDAFRRVVISKTIYLRNARPVS